MVQCVEDMYHVKVASDGSLESVVAKELPVRVVNAAIRRAVGDAVVASCVDAPLLLVDQVDVAMWC